MTTEYEYTHVYAPDRSSVIKEVRYNDTLYRLYVKTVHGGWYGYDGVKKDVFHLFVKAPSKGEFWNYNVRGHFSTFTMHDTPTWVVTDMKPKEEDLAVQSSGDDYAMTLDYTGELTFTVNADSIVDAVSELDRLLKSLGVTGNYSVKEVKKV